MTIGDRIKDIRMHAGENGEKLTLEKFGQRISLTNQAISAMESGKSRPSNSTIDLICREFNINRDWLETGEGERSPLPTTEFDETMAELVEQAQDRVTRESLEKVLRWYLELDVTGSEFLFQIIKTAVEETKKDPE